MVDNSIHRYGFEGLVKYDGNDRAKLPRERVRQDSRTLLNLSRPHSKAELFQSRATSIDVGGRHHQFFTPSTLLSRVDGYDQDGSPDLACQSILFFALKKRKGPPHLVQQPIP